MHAAATCCEPRGQKRSVTAQLIETVVMLLTAQLRATLCYSFEVISRGLLMLMAGHTILRSDILLSDKAGAAHSTPSPSVGATRSTRKHMQEYVLPNS